ncbi:MAG: hypothetical protein IPL70_14465 [Uliginosibacterium sp.]|nr:hypothetical protein [Uliginosibacterium sp.]
MWTSAEFPWQKLTSWEQPVIAAEMARPDFVGWLRNVPRKPWALALAYELRGEEKPMYPDFLVVRKDGDNHIVDILEPHASNLDGQLCQGQGSGAVCRQTPAMAFGRIELIRLVGNDIRRLDLIDVATRTKVLAVDSNAGLDLVFDIVNP